MHYKYFGHLEEYYIMNYHEITYVNNPSLIYELDLSGGHISELPENFFNNFTNLEILDLSVNQIKSLSPNIFRKLKKLHYLNLGFNKLTQLPEKIFILNKNLEEVYLNNNLLSIIEPTIFINTKKLKHVYLNFNKIKMLAIVTFCNLPLLEVIDLSYNKLKSIPNNLFNCVNLAKPNKLVEIDLSFNIITEVHPNFIATCVNLNRLYLCCNYITNYDFYKPKYLNNIGCHFRTCHCKGRITIHQHQNWLQKILCCK